MRTFGRLLGISVSAFLIVVFVTLTIGFIRKFWLSHSFGSRPHVTVIEVTGVLFNPRETLRQIGEELDDKETRGLVIRVDSPGGLVAPSQELFEALKQADKKVPVVVSMGAVAASGGYYVSLGGREIFAEPGTLTASIGVIMEFANTEKLYHWAKIERFALTAGKLKDAGSPLKPMSTEERAFFNDLLFNIHSQFRKAVKARRNLSDQQLNSLADGRVMTGEQAYQSKLIDVLGGLDDAIKEAKNLAHLPESTPVVYTETEKGLVRRLLFGENETLWERLVSTFDKETSPTLLSPSGWTVMLLAPIQGRIF